MTASEILQLVTALIGGAGLGSILTYLAASKRLEKEEKKDSLDFLQSSFQLALAAVTKQRDDALARIEEHQDRIQRLELEIVGVKLANSFDPFPRWLVDLGGKYLFANSCFEERYLKPQGLRSDDIIGQGHEAVWPEAVCQTIVNLDRLAKSRPDGRARAAVHIQGHGDVNLYKFPVRNSGIIVAYAGYITELE